MKILQLNVWNGRIKGAPTRFLREHDFDVVCLQEAVWSDDAPEQLSYFVDTVDDLMAAGNFKYDYRCSNWCLAIKNGTGKMEHGNVIISKLPIVRSENSITFGEYVDNPDYAQEDRRAYNVQKVELENGVVIANHHGYWLPNPVGDDITVECMRKVADFVRNETKPLVLCGDMNIIAESPAMRELDFLRDLTLEYKFKTTLQNLKFVLDVPCDHVLVSDDIKVISCQTHDELISDHKAISTEIEF